jgi:3-methyladenine DNA glycosylase AlkD
LPFYGVQTPTRRKIVKDFVAKQGLPSKENYQKLVLSMMQHPKREMNYCAIDIALRCQKMYLHEDDLPFIHELIATRSWWDSVDAIAPHLLGRYLLKISPQSG